MKQLTPRSAFILGVAVGIFLVSTITGWTVFAEQSRWNPNTFQFEPVPQPTPQEYMLQYNLNRWLQQQAQHPC